MANETEDKELKDHREPDQSRRNFLKNSGYAVGGLIVGGVVGSLLRTPKKATTNNNANTDEWKQRRGSRGRTRQFQPSADVFHAGTIPDYGSRHGAPFSCGR